MSDCRCGAVDGVSVMAYDQKQSLVLTHDQLDELQSVFRSVSERVSAGPNYACDCDFVYFANTFSQLGEPMNL